MIHSKCGNKTPEVKHKAKITGKWDCMIKVETCKMFCSAEA